MTQPFTMTQGGRTFVEVFYESDAREKPQRLWYTEQQLRAAVLEALERALDAIPANGCETAGDCIAVIRQLAEQVKRGMGNG